MNKAASVKQLRNHRPWFQIRASIVNDTRAQRIDAESFRLYINLTAIACEHGWGDVVLADVDEIAYTTRRDRDDILSSIACLIESGLIEFVSIKFDDGNTKDGLRICAFLKHNPRTTDAERHKLKRNGWDRERVTILAPPGPCSKPLANESQHVGGSLSQTVCKQPANDSRLDIELEIERELEIEVDKDNIVAPSARLSSVKPPTIRIRSKDIEEIFAHYRATFGKTEQAILTKDRRKLIANRLRECGPGGVETLRQSLTGYTFSKFHMGDNKDLTVYDSIELLLRNRKQVEMGLGYYEHRDTSPTGKHTRDNVAKAKAAIAAHGGGA